MNSPLSGLLLALQHGDNFFPSGTQAFSWGLETLVAGGMVSNAEQLNEFVASHLKWRWNWFDRPVLAACYRTHKSTQNILELDVMVETRTLGKEARECSRRAGEAFLILHSRLGNTIAADYRNRILKSEAYAHNAVVQGLIWRSLGIECSQAELMSAHMLRTQLVSAALRLGVIGHIDAQLIISEQQSLIEQLLEQEVIPVERIGSFTPQIEIAVMQHEVQSSRLFVN